MTNTVKHSKHCARCGIDAILWSGAWEGADGEWIGWCSKRCQNAWLRGDKYAPALCNHSVPLWESCAACEGPGVTSEHQSESTGGHC